MQVIVGGIIEKDGKYLLVQEAQEKAYKKWNSGREKDRLCGKRQVCV